MNYNNRILCAAALCGVLAVVGSGCGKAKEPPPGAPTDAGGTPPTIDLGTESNPSSGTATEPSSPEAGRETRQPGISGEGQAPEEPAAGTNK